MPEVPGFGSAVDEALDAIEHSELRALRWGYAGGWITRGELLALLKALPSPTGKEEEIVGELLERALLFRFSGPGDEEVFRSRFAEGIRLLTSLKQQLPWRPSWAAAPNLVSDYRVDLRPRRFARRDQPADAVVEDLAERFGWSGLQRNVAHALLSRDAQAMDLAGFQVRAIEAILERHHNDRGVIISAGTGSGKTLAYYLPAIVLVSPHIQKDDYWTKAISVYPRTALLADQFSEVFRLARAASEHLPRPLRIGALYGPTPFDASPDYVSEWDRVSGHGGSPDAFVCPFLVCPKCGGRMVWPAEDVRDGIERLVCEQRLGRPRRCDVQVGDEEIALTRRSVQERRPDLLFTTAETLNQRMSDGWSRHVFGLGQVPERRPQLMLLDEVHTYEGIAGAQAALVLRRWRHAIGGQVRWVGLSATLSEAQAFFSQLIGVDEHAIHEVAARPDEYESEAAEYQVLLRGDPVSQAALLSTSIQAAFLLTRLLDPPGSAKSDRRVGERLFVFTDDLDVTNRLFDDLRDAERPSPPRWEQASTRRPPLAALRDPRDDTARFQAGQDWRALEVIGWDLGEALDVSRTSSQDAGVSAQSDIVVATGALEVGFNDVRVGAILQHKSPHGISSFVQRKGRAGRDRAMRPWMVTILSDYGRDRTTYQAYEQLFEPHLPHQRLPIENGYIQRMQAGFAFIDWLAKEHPVEQHPDLKGWWWWAVHGPPRSDQSPSRQETTRRQQDAALGLLNRLLDGDEQARAALARHLRGALSLTEDEVIDVLWEPPRPLMLEFLPTLRRRLASEWQLAAPTTQERLDLAYDRGPPRPMPEFLPSSLFRDLNLPDVAVEVPSRDGSQNPGRDSMMIDQALRHLAPGRVTRRFAPRGPGVHHWIPVPVTDDGRVYELTVDRYAADFRHVADVPVEIDGRVERVPIFRPWLLRLVEARTPRSPRQTHTELASEPIVLPSSNAFLTWSSQIVPLGDPLVFRPEHDPDLERAH